MPKGRKITRMIELEVCTLRQSAEEFYRHNRVKGLSNVLLDFSDRVYGTFHLKIFGNHVI